MRFTSALVACLLPLAAYGKACEGENLPPDAKIRIGIKHRPEDCTQKAKNGDRLRVHYEGKLYKDCTVFDSNKRGDTPFAFVLGSRSVIKGWDQGLIGMCVGERRRVSTSTSSLSCYIGAMVCVACFDSSRTYSSHSTFMPSLKHIWRASRSAL
eukprot:1528-Heterococcus_DN1.PRE.3